MKHLHTPHPIWFAIGIILGPLMLFGVGAMLNWLL